MKLHLPPSLRAALLSCFALAGGFFTAGSGTISIGSALVAVISTGEALGQWVPPGITYTGNVSVPAAATEVLNIKENSTITYAYSGNVGSISAAGFDVKLKADDNNKLLNLQNNTFTSKSMWFSAGRFAVNGSVLANAGDIYAQGGQLFLSGTLANKLYIGSSAYSGENLDLLKQVALRLEGNANVTGTTTLVEDAVISTYSGATGTLTGELTTGNFLLTKQGTGTLLVKNVAGNTLNKLVVKEGTFKYETGGSVSLSEVVLNNGTMLSVHNITGGSSIVASYQLVNKLTLDGNASLQTINHAGGWRIADLQGTNRTLTMLFEASSNATQYSLVEGGNFSGVLDIRQTNAGVDRSAVFGVSNKEVLANARLNMSQRSSSGSGGLNYSAFAVGANGVKLLGVDGVVGTYLISYDLAGDTSLPVRRTISDLMGLAQSHTLELTGSGTYTFNGMVGDNLIINKTGTGTQNFSNIGNKVTMNLQGGTTLIKDAIGNDITINLEKGSLIIRNTVGTGAVVNTSEGTFASVPWRMTGNVASYERPAYVLGDGDVSLLDCIAGLGNTSDGGSGNPDYTILNSTGFTGTSIDIVAGLVSVCNGGNGAGNANFGTISKFVLDGGGLIVANSNGNNTYTVTQDIEVKTNGFLRAWGADYGNGSAKTFLTGTISGNGTLTKTDQGKITLQGDMSGFTGTLVIASGSLAFDTDATLTSFIMRNDCKAEILNGHKVVVNAAVTNSQSGIHKIALEQGADLSLKRLEFNAASTLELSSATNGSMTVEKFTGGNTGNTTVNIGANTALNITGSSIVTTTGTFVTENTFLLNHYNSGASVYTINGTLNMLNCATFSMVNPAESPVMKVNSGGVLNLQGLNVLWRDGIVANRSLNLTLEAGSMMNLGSSGINPVTTDALRNGAFNLILNGGTIGILDSTLAWSTSNALTLNGDVSIDTRLYSASLDGKAGSYRGENGTITLSGAITGTGTLIKKGGGTLLLKSVDKLDVQGGYVGITGGGLTIGSLTTMTESGGRFALTLGGGKITAATYAGRVNMDVAFTTGGTIDTKGYDVFQGAAGLAKGDVNIRYFLDRGLVGSYVVTNGLVHVLVSGTVDPTKYNLTWSGGNGALWTNSSSELGWTGGDQRFSTGDNVTFNGGGIKDIGVLGQVNPGSITVTGTENYTFRSVGNGAFAGNGVLTKSGTGKLTLFLDTAAGWTGNVDLQGGVIAFMDGLGKTNKINVSGTAGLEWLNGNTADISSRLVVAQNSNLTFDTGNNSVTFGSVVANAANYVKTGSGTMRISIAQALSGSLSINQGDVIFDAGGALSSFKGAVTINNGGRLILNVANATGWNTDDTRLANMTINEGGTLLINTPGTQNQLFGNMIITLQGGTIASKDDTSKFDIGGDSNGTTSITSLASATTSVIDCIINIRQPNGGVFTVADGAADVDLLISRAVSSTGSNKAFTKEGAGVMSITGTTTVGGITVNGGKLILANTNLNSGNLSLAGGTEVVFAEGTFKWNAQGANRIISSGTVTVEKNATVWTYSGYKYHNTIDSGATLKGSGKWITGIPTTAGQTDGYRQLTINGNTKDFTGILELQGTSGNGTLTSAYRTMLILNSADGVLGGVVRTQGVIYNGGLAENDNSVDPLFSKILLKKSMQIGGIEGRNGVLETDVTAGIDLTVGDAGDHKFTGSMTGKFKSLVKQGSGNQIFDGDLSASLAGIEGITVAGGHLGLGASTFGGNLTLSGEKAKFSSGGVSIGTGKVLTVSAKTTMIDSNLDLAGGSVVLGTEIGDFSVALNSHTLNLSSTNKTALSLELSEELVAGSTVDLFTGLTGLTNNNVALTLGQGALLSDYFTTTLAGLQDAKIQLVNGKLQAVLARSLGALLYGQGNNGTWETDKAFESSGTVFTAGKNVSFDRLGTNETMTVQLKEDLNVGAITIAAGDGNTYKLVQEASGGKIVASTGVLVNNGTLELTSGVFAPTAASTITVNNSATLLLNDGSTNENVSFALATGGTLKWGSGNSTDYSSFGGITVASGANVTLDLYGNNVSLGSAIANSATYTAKGGNLTLTNHDVLSGSLILSNSNLTLSETATTGSSYALSISGTGSVSVSGANKVVLSGANTYTGATNLLANSYLQVTNTSLSGATSQISLATGSTFDYEATVNVTLDRKLTGDGNVIFRGAKEITLTGANDYTGSMTVSNGTTLKASNTSIGNAGNSIINNGTLHFNTGANAYTANQLLSGAGAIRLEGSKLVWNTAGKTYTGSTTIASGSTVSSSGALTNAALGSNEVRLINIETGAKLVLTDAAKTNAWLDNAGSNTSGLFLRGAGTVRLDINGEVTSDGFIARAFQNSGSVGKLELASGARLNISTDCVSKFATITAISVENGANITFGFKGDTSSWSGGALSIAGAGLASSSGDKAAALSITADGFTLKRSLSLANDATLYVGNTNAVYGLLDGAYVGNNHRLTKTGQGVLTLLGGTLGAGSDTTGGITIAEGSLRFNLGANSMTEAPYIWKGSISIADGAKLEKYDGYTRLENGISVAGSTTIWSDMAKGWEFGAVTGSGTITLSRGSSDAAVAEQLILTAANSFSGTWNVTGLWTLNIDHASALSASQVSLGQSSLELGVASADLVGLEGSAGASVTKDASQTASSLVINGALTKTYSGSVGTGVTVEMNGTGKQILDGSLADGSKLTATRGELAVSSLNQTGSHTFLANGGTLNMKGYTRSASASGSDSVVYKGGTISNLNIGKDISIMADDSFIGDIMLGGTTTFSGGKMVFRLTETESPVASGYYDLATKYAVAVGGGVTMGTGSDKTLLVFVPDSKNLYPDTGATGKDYTLISNIGNGLSESDLARFEMNMSSQGRTKYTLKISNGNLVLNVNGSAALLTWKGIGSAWNGSSEVWDDNGNDAKFMDDDFVFFGTLASSQSITIDSGGVKMGGMTVVGSTDYTFNGGAISSSSGNTNAGLRVGTVDNAFSGVLTLNTENTYAGNTEVNSGTVIASNQAALSNTKLTINGGKVSLAFAGTLGTSSVEMKGGVLDASSDAVVDKIQLTEAGNTHTFTASTGKTLTLKSSSNTIAGAWAIGSSSDGAKAGTVKIDAGALNLSHSQNITVYSGSLLFDGTTGTYTGANLTLSGGNISVQGGMTASFKKIDGASGDITLNNSTLGITDQGSVTRKIVSESGTVYGKSGLILTDLSLKSGNTALTGSISLNGLAYGANTTLSVGNAATAGSVVLGAQLVSLDNIDVVNGSLTIKDNDRITSLASAGTITTQAAEAVLNAGTANLKGGATVDAKISLKLSGSGSWLGENGTAAADTVAGKITLDGVNASAHIGDRLRADSILVKEGTLLLDKTTGTVTNGITLEGPMASFDVKGNVSSLAVTMKQGGFANASKYAGIITVDDATAGRYSFNMGGLSADALVKINSLKAGSSLSNLGNIRLGDSTITLSSGMKPIFNMTAATGVVSLDDASTLRIIAGSVIGKVLQNGTDSFTLTNGSLSGLMSGNAFKNGVYFDPTLGLYNIVSSVNGGNMIFTALDQTDPSTIYKTTVDGAAINNYNAMDNITMVDINANTTIDLSGSVMSKYQEQTGLIIKNLHNTSESQTTLDITGDRNDLVSLDNNLSSTWFNGNINITDVALKVHNTNANGKASDNPKDRELGIFGKLTSNAGVSVENGRLVLNGNDNALSGGLEFSETETEKGVLVIKGTTTLGGDINGANGAEADILLENTTLTLNSVAALNAWISGSGNNAVIAIQGGGTAIFGTDARVDHTALFVDENRVADIRTISEGALSFNGISGKGSLVGAADADLTINAQQPSSTFSGDLDNYLGTIRIKGEGRQILESSMNAGSTLSLEGGKVVLQTSSKKSDVAMSFGNVTSASGSSLILKSGAQTDDGMSVNNAVNIGDLAMDGGSLTFDLNLSNSLRDTSGAIASVGSGHGMLSGTEVDIKISGIASDFVFLPGQEMTLFLMSGVDDASSVTFKTGSIIDKYYSSAQVDVDGGYLYLRGIVVNGDNATFHSKAALSETGRAGAGLLDYLYATRNPQMQDPGSIAADVLNTLENLIVAGNRGEADRIMAGVAGSTVTSLSAAFASSLSEQMDSIRNRMSGMGADLTLVNDDLPGFHAWISGNGGRSDLSDDGYFSGYSLNTWGGTLGVDVDVSEHVTIGAAFNASYGDLQANAAEFAKGDLDTYTVTAFARVQTKRWVHDFAIAGATADGKLNRTINYGDGTYSTRGTTSGFGMAALYEAAYSMRVGYDRKNIFQPLFRASFTHAGMDAYSETQGGALDLNVGKQSVSYATFGIGARYLANVGQSLYNRDSILELRALVLQDAGSRRGEADVALSGAPERSRQVKGSEPGSTGIQVGAGISVPIQVSSSVFADVNLNVRSKATTVNASLGYRVNF